MLLDDLYRVLRFAHGKNGVWIEYTTLLSIVIPLATHSYMDSEKSGPSMNISVCHCKPVFHRVPEDQFSLPRVSLPDLAMVRKEGCRQRVGVVARHSPAARYRA